MHSTFYYGINTLTYDIAMAIAKGEIKGTLHGDAIKKIKQSQQLTEQLAKGDNAVYGVNTGFGPLCDTKIDAKDTAELQHNLLTSHSAGVGKPIPQTVSKLMLVTKLQALSQGFSGIRLETLERIVLLLEKDIIPVVPEKGSVGASGDLAPLAHLFLPLIGLGEVWQAGKIVDANKVLEQHQIKPLTLRPKEALALINGTQFILSFAVLFLHRFKNILELADIIGALSLEGFQLSLIHI